MYPDSMNHFPDPFSESNSGDAGDFQGLEQTYGSGNSSSDGSVYTPAQSSQQYMPSQPMPGAPQQYTPSQPMPGAPQQYTPSQPMPGAPQQYTPSQPMPGTPQQYTPSQSMPGASQQYMPPQPLPPYPQYYPQGNPYGYPMPNRTVGNAGGLICGILSILMCSIPFIGLILGIIGFCLSLKARSDGNKPGNVSGSTTIPGIICSVIGGLLSLLITALFTIVLVGVINDPTILDDDDNYYEYSYYEYYDPGEYT